MRILVLGAAGMAGHTIAIYLAEKGHDVTAFTRKPFIYPHCQNIVGDAMDDESFKNLLQGDYDLIINCIGLLNKAAEDNHTRAVYLNSYIPHFIADTIKNTQTRLIHISTDCVFSGDTGGYTEGSTRDSETFYGRTKAMGEIDDKINLTLRTSIIGPDINPDGIGLFNWFMKQEGEITGYACAMWSGITTLTLAKAIEQAEGLSGLYNLTSARSISKYDLLRLFSQAFKNDSVSIQPVFEPVVDKSLQCLRRDFTYEILDYTQMICEMKSWMDEHSALYPQYYGN